MPQSKYPCGTQMFRTEGLNPATPPTKHFLYLIYTIHTRTLHVPPIAPRTLSIIVSVRKNVPGRGRSLMHMDSFCLKKHICKGGKTMNKLELFFIGAVDAVSAIIVIVILLSTMAMAHLGPFHNCIFGCG